MTKWTKTAAAVVALATVGFAAQQASAADAFTVQMKWVADAQFAGYYVAAAKGFYKDAGLDVTIKAGGPDIAPEQVIAAGGADAIVDWMPAALAARDKGEPLVNIAQVFQKSGLMLTCRKDSGIKIPADFKGKTLGVWFYGNEYPFMAWMNKLHLSTSGANPDVKVLKQDFNVDPILQKQAACISTMSYNEYPQILESGQLKADDLLVFKYQDQGVAVLEDGLYTLEKNIKDKAEEAKLAKFVKASMKGWDYAVKNQAEAVDIVMKADTTGAIKKEHQVTMMAEVAKLVEGGKGGTGYLEKADYERTVKVVLENKVISKEPKGAWTHAVFEMK
ncbi:MAG TPA: ABC transporter substrate-binding protein [Magnetospirillaceae bacterium]|jgi:NitT/TauT family transport system substrate-binding protein